MLNCIKCGFRVMGNGGRDFIGCRKKSYEIDNVVCFLKHIHLFKKEKVIDKVEELKEEHPAPQPEINPARAAHTTYLSD